MTEFSDSIVTDDGWEETFRCCQYESWDMASVDARFASRSSSKLGWR